MERYTVSGLTIPQLTILIGFIMTLLGLGFFFYTEYLTALFPTLFGVIFMATGTLSIIKPNLNALSMHIAVLASLVSTALGIMTVLFGTWTTTTSLMEQLLMSSISWTHLCACVTSYFYGNAKFPGDIQACGINEQATTERIRKPGPVSVVAISLET
tara:strand:+ start:3842 stop:4312 length:471 start_codon:yes stop_codon:yes gene_type:complete